MQKLEETGRHGMKQWVNMDMEKLMIEENDYCNFAYVTV